jgi:glucan biosynthesis protein C
MYTRRHDLDWLRVLAILVLHIFHTGMAFNSWGWHIKNDVRLPWLDLPMAFLHVWRMPLLFLISGIGTTFALRSRGLAGFVRERHRRLLIPVLFGMLVIIPPQVFYERLFGGAHYTSFWAFYRTVLELTPYPQGNFSWHHLWFVVYLLVYSMLTVPFLALFKTRIGKQALDRARGWLGQGARIYLLILPLAAIHLTLRDAWPETHNLVADWANFAAMLLYFWSGILVASDERIWSRIEAVRRISLGLGFLTLGSLLVDDAMGVVGGYPHPIEYTLLAALSWFWIFAALGYGKHYLNSRNRVIDYANEGIYPFYILHQTVIVILGYYVISWPLGPGVKFVALLALSFAATVGVYEFLIRRWSLVRPFFGLKKRSRRKTEQAPAAVPELVGE